MEDVTKRGWPAPDWLCDFPEVNVRTYATAGGKRGVWFLSLDATNPLAVWVARTFFHAPYFTARVGLTETGGGINYFARRGGREFIARCAPGESAPAQPGTFAEWATERYCLYSYSERNGGIFRTEVQHPKWPLQRARVEIQKNTLSKSRSARCTRGVLLPAGRRGDVAPRADQLTQPLVLASVSDAQTTSQPLSLST